MLVLKFMNISFNGTHIVCYILKVIVHSITIIIIYNCNKTRLNTQQVLSYLNTHKVTHDFRNLFILVLSYDFDVQLNSSHL